MKQARFELLEPLRGLFAWWVVLFHCIAFSGYLGIFGNTAGLNLLARGDLAVDGFIILSGIVIAHLLNSKREKYAAYISRRFFRLAMIYYLSIVIALFFQDSLLVLFKELSGTIDFSTYSNKIAEINSFKSNTTGHVFAHLFMLHGAIPNSILPNSATSILTPTWSISLEWQFYLVAPFIVKLYNKSLGFLLLFSLVFLQIIFYKYNNQFHGAFLPLRFNLFLLGVCFCNVYYSKNIKNISLTILMILISVYMKAADVTPIVLVLFAFFFPVAYPRQSSVFVNTHLFKICTNLGKISYSTYLFHQLVQFVILYFLSKFLISYDKSMFALVFTILTISFTFLLSNFLYKYVEANGIKLGRTVLAAKPAN